jgi:enamine deaminase RidA (YjgF/YER057c/UK114 family)
VKRIRLAGQLAEPLSHYTDAVAAGGFLYIADRESINTVRRRYFGDARPASTLVEVSALANPDPLVEIEAVALLPPRDAVVDA